MHFDAAGMDRLDFDQGIGQVACIDQPLDIFGQMTRLPYFSKVWTKAASKVPGSSSETRPEMND